MIILTKANAQTNDVASHYNVRNVNARRSWRQYVTIEFSNRSCRQIAGLWAVFRDTQPVTDVGRVARAPHLHDDAARARAFIKQVVKDSNDAVNKSVLFQDTQRRHC